MGNCIDIAADQLTMAQVTDLRVVAKAIGPVDSALMRYFHVENIIGNVRLAKVKTTKDQDELPGEKELSYYYSCVGVQCGGLERPSGPVKLFEDKKPSSYIIGDCVESYIGNVDENRDFTCTKEKPPIRD
ncbi:hypothetical protein ACH5RR_037069 [Cinchona calisaya]|uniref:Uncharacterized protein n=1 Tax=Cinchona calisaya TaxID=153742 RepID=A0ABD2Y8V0_9GENT